MRRLLASFLAVMSLVPGALSATDAGDWRLERDAEGIRIYTRAVPGWSIREIRGLVRIPARLASVVAVIDDVPASPQLNPLVAQASIHQRASAAHYHVYSTVEMPWPLADRDVLSEREIRQDAGTLVVTIRERAQPGLLPPREGFVRIVQSHQQWTLTPLDGGAVQAEMRLLSDPAGPIPAALVNALSVSTPFDTLARLREMAQRPPYRDAVRAYLREPSDVHLSSTPGD